MNAREDGPHQGGDLIQVELDALDALGRQRIDQVGEQSE